MGPAQAPLGAPRTHGPALLHTLADLVGTPAKAWGYGVLQGCVMPESTMLSDGRESMLLGSIWPARLAQMDCQSWSACSPAQPR